MFNEMFFLFKDQGIYFSLSKINKIQCGSVCLTKIKISFFFILSDKRVANRLASLKALMFFLLNRQQRFLRKPRFDCMNFL